MSELKTPTSKPILFYARGRFLVLDEPKPFQAGQKPRWEATFIIDPTTTAGAASIKEILLSVSALAKEHYGKVPLAVKKLAVKFIPGTPKLDLNDPKNEPDDIRLFCLQDGDAEKYKNYAGYKGMFIVTANNSKLRPDVVNLYGQKVKKGEKQYPYDGADLRGSISFWLLMGRMKESTGPLVGCNLRGVQFVADNKAFTQDAIDDEFEPLAEDAPAPAAASSDFD
jgi:hypothetical protein